MAEGRGRKGKWILLSLIVVAVFGAYVVARARKPAVVEYSTAPIDRGALKNVVNATGVVETVVTVQVGSQVSGQVRELFADFNSVVKRGQLLAKLDPRAFEAAVLNSRANLTAATARVKGAEAEIRTHVANKTSAEANLVAARVARDNAQTLFRRSVELQRSGLVSSNDFDTAKANSESAEAKYQQAAASVAQVEAQAGGSAAQLEQANAQVEQARADLERSLLNVEYTSIYSPVDGVVISRNVDVGQTIAASMQAPTLFVIANDLGRMRVNASVDEADIGTISGGAGAQFSVGAYPGEVFQAKIAEIRLNPQTVQNVVTYGVILSVDNTALKLRPGMTASISFTVDERLDVVRVPNIALRYLPPGIEPPAPLPAVAGANAESGARLEPAAAARGASPNQGGQPLAPGQQWDPADKTRFLSPVRRVAGSGQVWVLNEARAPEMKTVQLGITDGLFTELVSGDLKVGDPVITGDSTAATEASRSIFSFGRGNNNNGSSGNSGENRGR